MQNKFLVAMVIMAMFFGIGILGVRTESSLTDISGSWAYPQISNLVKEDIIRGYPDSTFRPDNPITTAEFIVIVNRAFKYETRGRVSFSDVNRWDWYYADVSRAIAAGYLPPSQDSQLGPNTYITRENVASIIASILKLDTSETDLRHLKDAFSVSSENQGAVTAVIKAGYMIGYSDGTFRPLDPITRAEAAVIISKCIKPDIAPASAINVKDYGAQGDGWTDDTAAINAAIDAVYSNGGGSVYLPDGTYKVSCPTQSSAAIVMKSNVQLVLSSGATITLAPNPFTIYWAVYFGQGVINASISGGHIEGDRFTHQGTTGESGHAIAIHGGIGISVSNISLSKCWGDGLFICGQTSNVGYAKDIEVRNVFITDCRRQGISVISVDGLNVIDCTVTYINGTLPMSGLDLEPNNATQVLKNILIDNFHTEYCSTGIEIWLGWGTSIPNLLPVTNVENVIINNHTDVGSRTKIGDAAYYTRYYDIRII